MFGLFKNKKPVAKAGEEKKKAKTSKKKTSAKKSAPKAPTGLETRTQIKQFQLANGLLPTGLLDEATLEKAKK